MLYVFSYLALLAVLLFWEKRGGLRNIVKSEFLGERGFSFLPLSLSIVATEVSALTLLSLPSLGLGQQYSIVSMYLGAVGARIFIALFLVKHIYGKELSIFKTAFAHDNEHSKKALVILFAVFKIFSVGVKLLAGALLLSQLWEISLFSSLALILLATFAYTQLGGFRTVVKTDVLQFFIFVIAGILAHFYIPHLSGRSWTSLWQLGGSDIWGNLNSVDFTLGLIGGFFFDLSTHWADQDMAQRIFAGTSRKESQKAIVVSAFISLGVGLLFLSIGSLLAGFAQLMQQNFSQSPDRVFMFFIAEFFPAWLSSFFLIAIMAATMSTIDSTLNALNSCIWIDLLNKVRVSRFRMFVTSFLLLLFLLIVAFWAQSSNSLYLLGLQTASWVSGILLAIFVAAFEWRSIFSFELYPIVISSALSFGFCFWSQLIAKNSWLLNPVVSPFIVLLVLFLFKRREIGRQKDC